MVDIDYDPDPMIFPSQAWFVEYGARVDADEEYSEMGEGWGVDFNGDFIFETTGLPIEEMDTDAMPEYLQDEIETYLTETGQGYTGQAYMAIEDGSCSECYLIESEDDVDNGFYLRADLETWKELLRQELGVIDGLMSGDFELDGDMQKVLQYSDAAVKLTEIASSIDAEFADERF